MMPAMSRRGSNPPGANMSASCSRNARSYCANEVPSSCARPRLPCSAIERPGWAKRTLMVSTVVESIALRVRDDDGRRTRWIAGVFDPHDGAIEPQPRRLARAIERAEVDAILPHRVDGARTGDGVGDERLHHQSRESAVAVGEHLVAELLVAVLRKLVLNRVVAVRRQHVR